MDSKNIVNTKITIDKDCSRHIKYSVEVNKLKTDSVTISKNYTGIKYISCI